MSNKDKIKKYLIACGDEHASIDEIANFFNLPQPFVVAALDKLIEEGNVDYKWDKNCYKNARQLSDRRYFWCDFGEDDNGKN